MKTIKIDESVYWWLRNFKSRLEMKHRRRLTYSDVVKHLLEKVDMEVS